MMKTTKKISLSLIILILLSISQTVNAQSTTWTPLDTINNVVISYQQISCSGTDVIALKIENTTGFDVHMNYSLFSGEEIRYLLVPASTNIEGDCIQPELLCTIPLGQSIASISQTIFVQ